MRKLTEEQLNFLTQIFFKYQGESYAGWENIARKLLTNGSCIVPRGNRIWVGNIGNFINIVEAEEAVNCVKYIFDESFFESKLFEDFKESKLQKLAQEKQDLEKTITEIEKL